VTGGCQGDSGGPMLVHGPGGQFVDIGIVSTNSALGCAIKGQYDIFSALRGTRIGTWLDSQVTSLHASPPTRNNKKTSTTKGATFTERITSRSSG
jgi:secreted trypsin-like serine protease